LITYVTQELFVYCALIYNKANTLSIFYTLSADKGKPLLICMIVKSISWCRQAHQSFRPPIPSGQYCRFYKLKKCYNNPNCYTLQANEKFIKKRKREINRLMIVVIASASLITVGKSSWWPIILRTSSH